MALSGVSSGNQPSYVNSNAASSTQSGAGINLPVNLLNSGNNTLFVALLALVLSLLQQIEQQTSQPEDQAAEENTDDQENTQHNSNDQNYNYNIDFWGLNNFGALPDFWSSYDSPFQTDSDSEDNNWW